MTQVGDLMPGNVVCVEFERATFITQTPHPLWPNLQLVIWKMEGDLRTWSLDALSIGQDIGEVEPSTPESRIANLRAALLGGA